MSTFSLVGSRSPNGMRMCVCVDGMNLKYALLWHIHRSVYSVLCQYYNLYTQAHAHTPPQTIWGQRTDRAKSGYCRRMYTSVTNRVWVAYSDEFVSEIYEVKLKGSSTGIQVCLEELFCRLGLFSILFQDKNKIEVWAMKSSQWTSFPIL